MTQSNPTIFQIIAAIESHAPLWLQEDWDNSGLIIGDSSVECRGVMTAFDVNEAVVAEAARAGCNLIVAHHPLIFKGLKRLNGHTAVERTVIAAIRAGIAVYASHTASDNAPQGVSMQLGQRLGLRGLQVLAPAEGSCLKLTTYVPHSHADAVRQALFDAGAGHIGNYDSCSYSSDGRGTFRALDGANPYVGTCDELHTEAEERIEVIAPKALRRAIEAALIAAHPYEEPAYEFTAVDSGADRRYGCGAVGNLPTPLTPGEFADLVKKSLGATVVRCSAVDPSATISRVGVCGGSGAFLAPHALSAGAQAFVTGDIKYHDFADYAGTLMLVDAGHFETEQFITLDFCRRIREIFPNFAVRCSHTATNPVIYM